MCSSVCTCQQVDTIISSSFLTHHIKFKAYHFNAWYEATSCEFVLKRYVFIFAMWAQESLFLLWKLLFKMHKKCIFRHNSIPATSHVIWPTHIMFYSSVSHVKCLACYSNTEWDTYYMFHYHTAYTLHTILDSFIISLRKKKLICVAKLLPSMGTQHE